MEIKMMKKLLFAVALAVSIFGLTGCYDAIYQSIRNEVELEEGTISGFVNNIARFTIDDKQYLFTTNGLIYCKDASVSAHGAWNKLSGNGLPSAMSYSYWESEFKGVHFHKIIADSKYVYALGYLMEYKDEKTRNQPSGMHLYWTEPTKDAEGNIQMEWHKAEKLSDDICKYMKDLDDDNYRMDCSVHLFGTNTIKSDNRKAYLRIAGGSPYNPNVRNASWDIYELNGANIESLTPIKSCSYNKETKVYTYDGSEKSNVELNAHTLSAVWVKTDTIRFLNSLNAETNENVAGASSDPTYFYFSDNGCCDNGQYLSAVKISDLDSAEKVKVLKSQAYKERYDGSEEVEECDAFKAYFAGLKSLVKKVDSNGTEYYESAYVIPYKVDGEGNKTDLIVRKKLASIPIISLAVTKDTILLGTGYNRSEGSSSGSGDGVLHVTVTDGIPADNTSSFSTNADNVMCPPYHVRLLFCSDPSKNEVEADLYSSIDYIYTEGSSGTSIKNRGLWSYYPGRGNWNRE